MLKEQTVTTSYRTCDICGSGVDDFENTFIMGGHPQTYITKFGKDICFICAKNMFEKVEISEEAFTKALEDMTAWPLGNMTSIALASTTCINGSPVFTSPNV